MRLSTLFSVSLLCASSFAFADNTWQQPNTRTSTYTISITNITKGMSFTPILNSIHSNRANLFTVGEKASDGIADVAEAGATDRLKTEIMQADTQASFVSTTGLLAPGATVTIEIEGERFKKLSMASMLLPTNDTFFALDGVDLPSRGSVVYYANAYDAGSEKNDELCVNIPGPRCGGLALSPSDSGEGFVFQSPGIHGEANLSRATYNWQGPVAKVVITKMR